MILNKEPNTEKAQGAGSRGLGGPIGYSLGAKSGLQGLASSIYCWKLEPKSIRTQVKLLQPLFLSRFLSACLDFSA